MLKVIDLFCGAGGFSEGFRQQGFEIILGVDCWKPAIDTFNHNFNLNCEAKNILDYAEQVDEIEMLPDSDIIIGSPPCVSFSTSNKSGKGDKSLGIRLAETFLRIVALKKHKPKSKLKAWFMENVVNSKKYLKDHYTFNDLNLSEWAMRKGLNPSDVALSLDGNREIMNAADYGAPQKRKRLITGEIISLGKFSRPEHTHKNYNTLRLLRDSFPKPNERNSSRVVKDPLYGFCIPQNKISDHFYDTGLYELDWDNAKYLKTNHPYMGKMSFPENIDAPSRTVMATKFGNSREALIYKSEYKRKGDGEYRTPTVREAAIIMGFPITYQFLGSENLKWKLVGNAVCPHVSKALAKELRKLVNLRPIPNPIVVATPKLDGVINLNTFKEKEFNSPPLKKKGARFRRHPFKDGNMTVALINYNIEKNGKPDGKWRSIATYGTGEGYGVQLFPKNFYKKLETAISNTFQDGEIFIEKVCNELSKKISDKYTLQELYEKRHSKDGCIEPTKLIQIIAQIIEGCDPKRDNFSQNGLKIFNKPEIPKRQLYALYAINKIISVVNGN